MEDEILNICRTFSIENKNQEKNLIETIKQNCRKIIKEKLEKNHLQILILQEFNGNNGVNSSLCDYLVDCFFFSLTFWNSIQQNSI